VGQAAPNVLRNSTIPLQTPRQDVCGVLRSRESNRRRMVGQERFWIQTDPRPVAKFTIDVSFNAPSDFLIPDRQFFYRCVCCLKLISLARIKLSGIVANEHVTSIKVCRPISRMDYVATIVLMRDWLSFELEMPRHSSV